MESILYKFCSPEHLDLIKFHQQIIKIKKGEKIFNKGDQVSGLYVINEGKAKVCSKDKEGTEKLVRLADKGDIIGHRGFGGDWKYPLSAIALTDCIVSHIPLKIFNIIAKTNIEFTYNLMMFFAEELRESEGKSITNPVLNRVAKSIYFNYRAFGFESQQSQKLSFTLSRKDIANMSQTTYESVIRTLSELNKMKVIKLEAKSIIITDLEKLKDLVL